MEISAGPGGNALGRVVERVNWRRNSGPPPCRDSHRVLPTLDLTTGVNEGAPSDPSDGDRYLPGVDRLLPLNRLPHGLAQDSGIFTCELASASASGFHPRAGCASLRMRSIMYGWCSSNAGRSDLMRGNDRKLCRGGGELVAHSSELP